MSREWMRRWIRALSTRKYSQAPAANTEFPIFSPSRGRRLFIRRRLHGGEIAGYGYFPGVELQQVPPLVYLVAPALRFHPPADELLKYLSAELEIVCVGLRESWRRGLQIVMRQ